MFTKISVESNKVYLWKVGQKEIFVRLNGKEWQYHIENLDRTSKPVILAENVEEAPISDWLTVIGDGKPELLTVPSFPDRPIVIKQETSFKILPGKEVNIFAQIPVSLQFYAVSHKKEHLLFETPSRELSSTWFGESDSGTLAYSLRSTIAYSFERPNQVADYVICPVKLVNESSSPLVVQRLLLQCDYLTIYGNELDMYSNEITIKFKGVNEISDVLYANKPPIYVDQLNKITSARSVKSSGVISKSFSFIKSLTNY